jgi:hypothetical protein
MPEIGEPRRALSKRKFEGWNGGQCGSQPQDLEQLAGRAISRDDALTETVGKEWSFRAIIRRKAGHDSPMQCNRKTNTPILKNRRKSLIE